MDGSNGEQIGIGTIYCVVDAANAAVVFLNPTGAEGSQVWVDLDTLEPRGPVPFSALPARGCDNRDSTGRFGWLGRQTTLDFVTGDRYLGSEEAKGAFMGWVEP